MIVQITKMFHSSLAVLISSTTLNISPETEAGFDAYDPKLPSRDAIFNNDTCKLQQLQKHIQDELHITTLCQQRKAEVEVEPNLHSTGHTNAKKTAHLTAINITSRLIKTTTYRMLINGAAFCIITKLR